MGGPFSPAKGRRCAILSRRLVRHRVRRTFSEGGSRSAAVKAPAKADVKELPRPYLTPLCVSSKIIFLRYSVARRLLGLVNLLTSTNRGLLPQADLRALLAAVAVKGSSK